MIENASSFEENKTEQMDVSQPMTEKAFDDSYRAAYAKVVARLAIKKTNGNHFQSAFRLFKIPPLAQLGFPSTTTIR